MRPLALAVVLASLPLTMHAQDEPETKMTAGIAAISASTYQSTLARADLAVARSVISPNLLRGEVGEAVRNHRVSNYLHQSGQWLDISPRLGPQGLDHVSIQLDRNNAPYRLMIDETKYGSGQLQRTVRGDIQMGDRYVSQRLAALSERYRNVEAQARGQMKSARVPANLSNRRVLKVPLSNTESVSFWRPANGAGTWHYDGPPESFPRARRQLARYSDFLERAANGEIPYPKRVIQVKPEGKGFSVTIRDASNVQRFNGDIERLPVLARLQSSPSTNTADRRIVRQAYAAELQRQMPHLNSQEAHKLAGDVFQQSDRIADALSRRSFVLHTIAQSAKAGIYLVPIALLTDAVLAAFGDSTFDLSSSLEMAALAGISGVAGNAAGQTLSYALIRNPYAYSVSAQMAQSMGMESAGTFANWAGGFVGGGLAAILFAYGGYHLGYYDLSTANRNATVGVVGIGAGSLASAAMLGAISVYGTAGTGAAISSLGGVAATNASLAWLGGGTLASGGFGVLGGTLVMMTGVGAVGVAASGAFLWGSALYDEKQEILRIDSMANYLSNKDSLPMPE